MSPTDNSGEGQRREAIWRELLTRGGSDAVSPEVLSEVGIRPHKTGQGIFRDKDRTTAVAPPHGVTLSLLDTGSVYDDAFDDDGGLYHYPSTRRPGRDEPEIEATKNCKRLGLPVFVILAGADAHHRKVRRAWLADWDDAARVFLIAFVEPSREPARPEAPFSLTEGRRPSRASMTTPRPGQARFKFLVVKRYGEKCAVCGLAVPQLLEAVHLCPVADGGTDDPRNGLVMCRNHHRAFDEYLFGLEPQGLAVAVRPNGPSSSALGISLPSLAHLPSGPHDEALHWRWSAWRGRADLRD